MTHGSREAYLNAAALVRAHSLGEHEAEREIREQLDQDEQLDTIETLTSVATWLLNAYSRTSGIAGSAALDLLLATIDEADE